MDRIDMKVLLLQKNLTARKIGKRLGLSGQYVSFILLGRRKGLKYRNRIAQILGKTKEELFGKETDDGRLNQ